MCVRTCARVCAHVRACVRVCACVCVHTHFFMRSCRWTRGCFPVLADETGARGVQLWRRSRWCSGFLQVNAQQGARWAAWQFWGCCSPAAAAACVPQRCVRTPSPHPRQRWLLLVLTGVRWPLTVPVVGVSLVTSGVSAFSCACCPSSWGKVCSDPLPVF